jgi:hypothetical protein
VPARHQYSPQAPLPHRGRVNCHDTP